MKKWKATEGDRPNRVTVYEREPGGILYLRIWNPEPAPGRIRKRSLGHRDKKRAKRQARAEALNLEKGTSNIMAGKITLAQLFALYLQFRSVRKKTEGERKTDERRAEMWARFLGGKTDPHAITLAKWEEFIDARLSGHIDSRGEPVDDPKPVRIRTVESNLKWLRWVFNWAVIWRTPSGGHLMHENPVRGFDIPTEKNPRRPVASHARYEAIRKVTDRFSYLSELFDLVAETGRRINAVCQLRYSDLRLDDGTPWGSIHWPGETDKVGQETNAPLSEIARSAVNRIIHDRPGIGDTYLFPSPKDAAKPISRHLAAKWLRRAEDLAGVEPLEGALWHAYRRRWVTERKHYPDVDVAAAGGWKNPETMKLAYQHADTETMVTVVTEPRRIREA